jgi:hypothetical protein
MIHFIRRATLKAASIRQNPLAHLSAFGIYYLALACFLFTLAVYYPGYMSPDSVRQLQAAREGVTDNGNPPMMAYVWRLTDHIIPGPGGMLILNTGLFWFALAAIAAAISRYNIVRAAVLLFCGFLPPVFGLIGTIWKDVGMHSFLLTALAFSLHARKLRRPGLLVWSTGFIWLAGTYRYNAFVATLPLILMNTVIAVPLLKAKYPRQAAALARRRLDRVSVVGGTAAVCVILWITISLVDYCGVKDAQLWRLTMLHDLVGMSVYEGVNLLPEEVTRKSQVTIEDLKKMYVGHNLLSIFRPSTRKQLGSPDPTSTAAIKARVDGKVVFKTWLGAVRDHPGAYLWHRRQLADKLLVLEAGNPWYPFQTGTEPNRYHIVFERSALNSGVMGWLQFAADSTYLYSAWIYHVLLLVVIVVSWLLPFRNALYIQLVAASGIVYALTNLFMAASADFRYNNWVIGACCICISLGASGFRTKPPGPATVQNAAVGG